MKAPTQDSIAEERVQLCLKQLIAVLARQIAEEQAAARLSAKGRAQ